jgi:hypothetical protein
MNTLTELTFTSVTPLFDRSNMILPPLSDGTFPTGSHEFPSPRTIKKYGFGNPRRQVIKKHYSKEEK